MKRILLILSALCGVANSQVWITPSISGNGASDSVVVSFCTFDTTLYPQIADVDSIIALRFDPENELMDSVTQASANVVHPRSGWYEIHYRAANSSDQLGKYRVYVRVKIGGEWRGAASSGYQVIGDDVGDYFARIAEASSGSGSGAYACTLFVFDEVSQTAIQGVTVRVTNSDESATAALVSSDANGRMVLSLDAGEFHAFAFSGGNLQEIVPAEFDVSSLGANDTIWMQRFDPGISPTMNLCRVYGYVGTLEGKGIEGVIVTARIQKSPLLIDGTLVSPYAITTTSDGDGYWYLDLIPNSAIDPDDTKYDFAIHYPSGTILRKQIIVPNEASYWLRW